MHNGRTPANSFAAANEFICHIRDRKWVQANLGFNPPKIKSLHKEKRRIYMFSCLDLSGLIEISICKKKTVESLCGRERTILQSASGEMPLAPGSLFSFFTPRFELFHVHPPQVDSRKKGEVGSTICFLNILTLKKKNLFLPPCRSVILE